MVNNIMNKKSKALKISLISIASILGLLFVGYLILRLSTEPLNRFGEPNSRSSSCGEGQIGCEDLKPIIYLYPENETALNIKLGKPENLTTTYPKHESSGWNVIAYPNGDLIDLNTNRKLYALYWEGKSNFDNIKFNKGFVVSGEDSAEFLEEKLEFLGLNYKESEEFITYWLPKLEKSPFNYIYFMTAEEIEEDMPIDISLMPDTLIRVRMVFQGLEQYEKVQEQILEPAPTRNGFTLVEWGGSEIE